MSETGLAVSNLGARSPRASYLVMAVLLPVVLLEKGLGLDVPGVALGDD